MKKSIYINHPLTVDDDLASPNFNDPYSLNLNDPQEVIRLK